MASVARPPEHLFDIVKHAIHDHQHDQHVESEEHPSTPPLAKPSAVSLRRSPTISDWGEAVASGEIMRTRKAAAPLWHPDEK